MKLSMKIYLLLSTFGLLTCCMVPKNCTQCDLPATIELNPIIAFTDVTPVLYSSHFEVLKYNFSGLVAFRQMPDSSQIRIVFLSEVGIRIMEFSYDNGKVTNTFCLDAIKRKSTINFISHFIEILLQQPSCRKICFEGSENKSNYFCKSKKGCAEFEYLDKRKVKTIFQEGRKKKADAIYSVSSYLPDEIEVKMRYKTVVHLKKVENAFK